MTEDNAVISFQPDGEYEDDARCVWTIECAAEGTVPVLTFEAFETEADYDYVEVSAVSQHHLFSKSFPHDCALYGGRSTTARTRTPRLSPMASSPAS